MLFYIETNLPFFLQTGENEEGSAAATATSQVPVSERIKCGHCETRLESVASVHEHHCQEHPELDFLWVDSTNGYTCNQSGEVSMGSGSPQHSIHQ